MKTIFRKKCGAVISGGILFAMTLHAGAAFAAVDESKWTTSLGQGVELERKVQLLDNGYQTINTIIADLNNPMLDLGLLYNKNGFQSRGTLTELSAQNPQTIGAVNGDFFSMSDPSFSLGPMVDNGKLLADPAYQSNSYAALLEDASKAIQVSYLVAGATVVNVSKGQEVALSSINKPSEGYKAPTLFTAEYMRQTPGANGNRSVMTEVIVDGNMVQEVRVNQPSVAIPTNGYAIVANGDKAAVLQSTFAVGDNLELRTALNQGQGIKLAMGGGSILIQNYNATPITKTVKGSVPRTTVATIGDNKLLLITVDGNGLEQGMTEQAMQSYLMGMGVKDALMLDGGGSTEMVVGGKIQNKVSKERKLLNGLAIVNTQPKGQLSSLIVTPLRSVSVQDEPIPLTIQGLDAGGNLVNLGEVTVQGVGFNGTWDGKAFTPTSGGSGQLMVQSGGISASVDMQVIGKNAADPKMAQEGRLTPKWMVLAGTADPSGKNVMADAMAAKLGAKTGETAKAIFFGVNDTVLMQNLQGKSIVMKEGTSQSLDNTAFICINPDKDLTTLQGQWSSLQSSLQGADQNVVVLMTKPLNLSLEGKEFWHKMLQNAAMQKNIIVISQGEIWGQFALGNISYLTVPAMSNAKASSIMDYKGLILGDMGGSLQYSFTPIERLP